MHPAPPPLSRRRRALAAGLAAGWAATLAGLPRRVRGAPPRIAYLSQHTPQTTLANAEHVRRELLALGLAEGRDYELHVRFAELRRERLPALAQELAAIGPALIIAPGPSVSAALQAMPQVPIVMIGDPVLAGAAASAHQPGGRVTGVNILFGPLNVKRLELLAELLPRGASVMVIATPGARTTDVPAQQAAADRLGLRLRVAYAESREQLEAALADARRLHVEGINQLNAPILWGLRRHTFEAAQALRLPAIYQWADAAAEGGLMAYGPRNSLVWRQALGIARRVLLGEPPARIPIEEPTHIQLALNLKAAAAIGLRFPPALLARADEVIE
jgi:putative ABC transport system substrate-binding protein